MSLKVKAGTRIMRWPNTRVVTPPERDKAVAPRVAEATNAPSVVARGA